MRIYLYLNPLGVFVKRSLSIPPSRRVMATAMLVFVSELTSLQEKPPNPRFDSTLRKYFKIPSIRRIPVKTYKIGTVAKEIGLSVKAIRFYEKIGLIPPPERTLSSGYRLFEPGPSFRGRDRSRFYRNNKQIYI